MDILPDYPPAPDDGQSIGCWEPVPELSDEEEDTPVPQTKINKMQETQIAELRTTKLQQEEAFGFHTLVLKEIEKCTEAPFAKVLATYQNSIAQFDTALKPARVILQTKKLTELDTRRDTAYRGLASHINNMLHHFEPTKAQAAEKLEVTLRTYGDPTRMAYIKENGILQNLIQELEKPQANAALATLNATDWLTEMKAAHTEFMELFSGRNLDQSEVVINAAREARLATDAAYRTCVKCLNALTAMDANPEKYAPIINAVNQHINYQKAVLAARKTRREGKEAETESAK